MISLQTLQIVPKTLKSMNYAISNVKANAVAGFDEIDPEFLIDFGKNTK